MLGLVSLRETVRNSTGNSKKLYGKNKISFKDRFWKLTDGLLLIALEY